jgi:signal transduction histidine kinase
MDEIEDASGRISTMVGAVKQYSHMDSATHADVDLHPGLESTVVMLGHKLAGVRVVREFDLTLPPVPAYAAELNQVWTNLIDNAADAMGGEGVLTLRTRRDGDFAVVEVSDDGLASPTRSAAGSSMRSSPLSRRAAAAAWGWTTPAGSSCSDTTARST